MFLRFILMGILLCLSGIIQASDTKQGKGGNYILHSYQTFPPISDRLAWENVQTNPNNKTLVKKILHDAEKVAISSIPPCSAIKYMEFFRTGNRSNYEKEYYLRRNQLLTLVLAEGLENKGRYVDKIIDYLCAISSEYTWVLPAHTWQKDALPYFEQEEIDLMSAETSHLIAQTLSLMEKELIAVSPNLVKRLKKQLMDRAIIPAETAMENYKWREWKNNWTPWICSNLLEVANYLLADNQNRLTAYVKKLTQETDRYYQAYSKDGGCEEGPHYWTLSPVCYFLYLEGLFQMSDGKYNRFGDDKFKRMCEYIISPFYKNGEVVTWGDSNRKVKIPFGIVQQMAERIKSNRLQEFVENQSYTADSQYNYLYGGSAVLYDLFKDRKIKKKEKEQDYLFVYSNLEQIYLRHGDRYLAVKAGNNGEHHGHLDVGQFVFRIGNKFLALDLGVGEYTKKTFSSERYDITTINSLGHNPLRFNGIGQGNGKRYSSRNFSWKGDHNKLTITMELTGCYPKELSLISYKRTLSFDGQNLTVSDEYSAEKEIVPSMTVFSEVANPILHTNMDIKQETYQISDHILKNAWGDSLTRLTLSGEKAKEGSVQITFGIK